MTVVASRTLARLATTNASPSVQDAASILETVASIEEEVSKLQAQMQLSDFSESLGDPEEMLRDLEKELRFFKPMVSAIRRMPVELLGEIFICACASDDHRRQTTLSRIMRVSNKWRQAAYSVPSLWNTVAVNPSKRTLTYDGVNSWIERARGLPCTVTASLDKCGWPGDGEACFGKKRCPFSKEALMEILTKTPSLERVAISCPSAQCFKNLSRSLDKAPLSEIWNSVSSITLKWDAWDDEGETIYPRMLERFFPRSLRSLQLHFNLPPSYVIDYNELFFPPPTAFTRLVSLHLTCDWVASHVFEILHRCSNLENLNLCRRGSDIDAYSDGNFMLGIQRNGLPLPQLKTIRLENASVDSLRSLQLLRTPRVFNVDIQFVDEHWSPKEPGDNDQTVEYGLTLADFLRGTNDSPFSVRILRIANVAFLGDTLLDVVKDLPRLERLILDNAGFNDDLFSRLSEQDALPNLRELQLLRLHIDREKLSGLQAFVNKRGLQLETSRCECADCVCA